MDRDKVINAINICLGKGHCDDCGYRIKGGYSTMDCRKPMLRDALALLKEQEPILVKRIDGKHNHFIKCGNCNTDLMSGMKYCPQCGKAVKWDADD